ncbi:hypothetical protein BC941DRAFT_512683 [Chlamydoabsidia padenii]|nr:hypothetical protein BC941DRAFT_512683 [Chlamydoabsidia padenii]
MLSPCQRKKSIKPHVRTACVNCKKAHLACDAERPCKRCISVGKTDSCYDIQHKKRGRPKLREKYTSSLLTTGNNGIHSSSTSSPSTIPKRPVSRHHLMPHFQRMLPLNIPSSTNLTPTSSLVTHQLTAPVDSLAPFLALSPSSSSFIMTNTTTKQDYDMVDPMNDTMMTLFLTTEMCCARASDETMDFIGYHPQELAHRSLYDFITNPADLHQIHQHLVQSYQQCINITPNDELSPSSPHSSGTSNNDYYHQLPPTTLLNIANGSKTFKMTLYFNIQGGKNESVGLNARFYFGGGLGADLCRPCTLDHLYIVCLLTKPSLPLSPQLTTSPPLMNLMTTDIQNIMPDLSSLSCLSSSLSSTYSSTSSDSSQITPTSCSSLMLTPPYSNNQIPATLDHEESSLYSWLDFAFSPNGTLTK